MSFLGLLRTFERIPRPAPRRTGFDEELAGELLRGETPNEYEPSLSDSELVAVRQMLEDRFGSAI
jgi:hypothetical protein